MGSDQLAKAPKMRTRRDRWWSIADMPLACYGKAELIWSRKENDASNGLLARPDKRDLAHFSLRRAFSCRHRTFCFAYYLQYTYRGRRILPSASQLSLLG